MDQMEEPAEYKNIQYYEKKLEYAVGVLEIVGVLINTSDELLKNENLAHLNKIVPKAIEQLKAKP
jgi:hypothetical protein